MGSERYGCDIVKCDNGRYDARTDTHFMMHIGGWGERNERDDKIGTYHSETAARERLSYAGPPPGYVVQPTSTADAFAARATVAGMIATERSQQVEQWGDQRHSDGGWLLILMEEVGELSKASLENEDRKLMLNEVVQAAAVLAAWAEQIVRESK